MNAADKRTTASDIERRMAWAGCTETETCRGWTNECEMKERKKTVPALSLDYYHMAEWTMKMPQTDTCKGECAAASLA